MKCNNIFTSNRIDEDDWFVDDDEDEDFYIDSCEDDFDEIIVKQKKKMKIKEVYIAS